MWEVCGEARHEVSKTLLAPLQDSLPEALRVLVMIFPIGALNRLMRSPVWDESMLTASLVLVLLGLVFFWVSVLFYRRYSE